MGLGGGCQLIGDIDEGVGAERAVQAANERYGQALNAGHMMAALNGAMPANA